MAYKAKGQKGEQLVNLEKALKRYQKKYFMSDPYTHPYDKVYLSEIEEELLSIK